jgi:hypothetical protein
MQLGLCTQQQQQQRASFVTYLRKLISCAGKQEDATAFIRVSCRSVQPSVRDSMGKTIIPCSEQLASLHAKSLPSDSNQLCLQRPLLRLMIIRILDRGSGWRIPNGCRRTHT